MEKKYLWRVKTGDTARKSRNWYTVIAVIAVGSAVASFIVGDILFSLLILLGAFALMLAGTPRPGAERTYALSEQGLHVDSRLVPWERVQHFALREGEPYVLVAETSTMLGTVFAPLSGIDFRAVRTEFKNHNIDEVDALGSFSEAIARMLGL